MRYVLAPITRPEQVAEEITRFVQHAGFFVVKMVRASAKTGVKTSCLVEVPDSFAEKAERVLHILTGLVPSASTLDIRPRTEWTSTLALPFDDLLAHIQSAVLEVKYTLRGATATLRCTEADTTLSERLTALGWTRTTKGIRSLVPMLGGLLSSTASAPISLPLQQGHDVLVNPKPITTAPPVSAKQSAYLADGTTDGPKLILGSAKDGSAIALAWKSAVLQLQARDEQLRSALLTFASRGFGEGCSVVLMAPRLVIRDFEELLPNRFRLLDTSNLWESVCIPWQTMERAALTHFLERHSLFQGVTLPAELPVYFRDLLHHVGADALATDALLALTAPPGDDLLGLCAASGGLLLPYDDETETGLILDLALQVLAPQNTTPFLIIRPPHIEVPRTIAAHAIQIVLGQEAQAHGVLQQLADGWELRFTGEVDTHYLRSDLSAKPIDSADLAVQSRVIRALQGDDFNYDADDEMNTVTEFPELPEEQLFQIIADPAPTPVMPVTTLPFELPIAGAEDPETVAVMEQPEPVAAQPIAGAEDPETVAVMEQHEPVTALPIAGAEEPETVAFVELDQQAETPLFELPIAGAEDPETVAVMEQPEPVAAQPIAGAEDPETMAFVEQGAQAIGVLDISQLPVAGGLDQQTKTPPCELATTQAEAPETVAFVELDQQAETPLFELTIAGAEDHETGPFELVIPTAFDTPEVLEILTTSMVSVVVPDEDSDMTEQEPLTSADLRSAFTQGVSFPQLVKLLQDEYPQIEREAIRSYLKRVVHGQDEPIPWQTEPQTGHTMVSTPSLLLSEPNLENVLSPLLPFEVPMPEISPPRAEPQGVHDVFLDGRIWRQWEDGVSLADLIAEIAKSQGLGKERSQDLLYQIVVPQVVEKLQAQDLAQRLAEKKKPLKAQQEVYMQLLCEVARAKSLSATTEQRTHERVVKALHVVLG
jgi:hypothetical protein